MSISSQCPGCQSKLAFDERFLGKKVRCKKCSHIFVIEAAAEKNKGAGIQRPPRRERVVADREREDEEMPTPPRKRKRDDDSIPSLRRTHWGLYLGLGIAGLALVLLGVALLLAVMYFGSAGGNPLASSDREFGGSWPAPRSFDGGTPEDTIVTLHIAAVADDNTREAISDKAMLLADGGRGGTSTAHHGDRTTILVTPVRDPQACADRIDFGTVRRVDGRVISVVAQKIEGLPANADALTKALYDLKSPNEIRRMEGVRRLKRIAPNERRNEVARALAACLKDRDPLTQNEVLEALGIWGTKESVPVLLDALATDNPFSRWAIFRALTHFPDEQVCEVLAQRLEDLSDQREAAAALTTIGAMAEKAVLKRLRHPEVFVRQQVCKILRAIGTNESLAALKNMVAEGEFFTKDEAEQAIRAIQARPQAGK